jgi:uncharacterized protein (TIGR01319 family)
MGMVAVEIGMERHVGVLESVYTPMGIVYSQVGKDLLRTRYLIGTGGILVHSTDPRKILGAGTFDQEAPNFLKPEKPDILIDRTYILSAMGLLAEKYPDKAVRIMKKYIIKA